MNLGHGKGVVKTSMWTYNKVLEYPIKIKNKNPRLAKIEYTQQHALFFISVSSLCQIKNQKLS